MRSASVSDGVQSLITAKYPEGNFLAIETSGDGAVNVYSRIQMALFKARELAGTEFATALSETKLDDEAAAHKLATRTRLKSPTHYPGHRVAGTAANAVYELR